MSAQATAATRGPAGPAVSPGFLLWHATLRWQRMLAAALSPLGLTHVQFVLLASAWWLAEGHEQPSQRRLAEHAGTDEMMTSQVLRTLEERGLLRRERDPHDARVRVISPTARGKRLARRAIDVVEAADAEFFEPVSRRQALSLLGALADRPL